MQQSSAIARVTLFFIQGFPGVAPGHLEVLEVSGGWALLPGAWRFTFWSAAGPVWPWSSHICFFYQAVVFFFIPEVTLLLRLSSGGVLDMVGPLQG